MSERRKKRRLSTSFQHRDHSLRVGASLVSALCGMHPYQHLPQVLCDLVYQSSLGQSLLRRDAALLGLTLLSRQQELEQWMALANRVSEETRVAMQRAVRAGEQPPPSVDAAEQWKREVERRVVASKKLTPKQKAMLVEGARSHVDTGFGTGHEKEALDKYEEMVGCRVRERNAGVVEWSFRRVSLEKQNGEGLSMTAEPLDRPRRWCSWSHFRRDTDQDDDYIHGQARNKAEPSPTSSSPSSDSSPGSKSNPIQIIHNDCPIDIPPKQTKKLPFFTIIGAVDGIRDEIYYDSSPPTKSNTNNTQTTAKSTTETTLIHDNCHNEPTTTSTDKFEPFDQFDHDSWTLRPIVVECKHRMKRAKVPPPLYDQIQTCTYCYMYEMQEADLLQVVRNAPDNNERRTNDTHNDKPHANRSNLGSNNNNNNNKLGQLSNRMEITITRISLNDPLHNHQYHWNATLLPRLSSFVNAVYTVRKDDNKRYRLLMALAKLQQDDNNDTFYDPLKNAEEEAWKIVWDECPWLRHCDTAYQQN